ncbi:MAG: DUF3667 domain-containing protein [Acidobacteriota bacterium]
MSEASAQCLNCDAPLLGRYCAQCGQDHRRARLQTRTILSDWLDSAFNFEATFWTTFRGMLRHPGQTAREYVDGRRKQHFHPFRYLLLTLLLYAAFLFLTGLKPTDVSSDLQPAHPTMKQNEFMTAYFGWVNRNFNFIMSSVIPVMALVLRFLFRASGLNYAEAMVLCSYVQGHSTVVITPLMLGGQHLFGISSLWGMLASLIYQSWAIRGFYRTSWWKAVGAYLLSFTSWLMIFMFLLTLSLVGFIIWAGGPDRVFGAR